MEDENIFQIVTSEAEVPLLNHENSFKCGKVDSEV